MKLTEVKHAFSSLKPNTTRVIVRGKTEKLGFITEFDNKYIPAIFKKNGIKFPKV